MPDENLNVDAYLLNMEKVGKSLVFTIELDDLPDVDKAEQIVRARLMAGGQKITILDMIGVFLYINTQNRIVRSK